MRFEIRFEILNHTFSTGFKFSEDEEDDQPEDKSPAIGFAINPPEDN